MPCGCQYGISMKTVALLSQKGGAGKTTLALHLACAAKAAGLASAIIDLDPQASAAASPLGDRGACGRASRRPGFDPLPALNS
jgi:cellulose biosynthesis protein BcsQ